MPLQKEIWIDSILNGLFAENSFLNYSVDHSEFVSNHVVHVPNAGKESKVEMDRASRPATVSKRDDSELTYQLHEFTTDPVLIENAEEVELSYNKRESVISVDRAHLQEKVGEYILSQWMPTKDSQKLKVTGKVTAGNISALQRAFNKAKIPQMERVILLGADAYGDLLDNLTTSQASAFLACADAQKGVVGNLYGFSFLDPRYALDGALGLAWHAKYVCRALGEVKMFEETDSPTYYGSMFSFLLRAGGAKMETDEKGVMSLVANA